MVCVGMDDIQCVLDAHEIKLSYPQMEEILVGIDQRDIALGIAYYEGFSELQHASKLSDIEDQLIRLGHIFSPKQFEVADL